LPNPRWSGINCWSSIAAASGHPTCMIDFPDFVRALLIEERRRVIESRALAGKSWKENGLVFPSEVGTPLEERNVLRRFQAVCEANGLPRLRLYDLRHTHASLLIHEGVHPKKISERLGHSSIKLTMDTYGHLFEGSDRDAAEKMERLFGEEPTKSRARDGINGWLGGVMWPDAIGNLSTPGILCQFEVVVGLKVRPKLRRRSKVAGQTECGVRRNCPFPPNNVIHPRDWHD
jgi:hypothetical protein